MLMLGLETEHFFAERDVELTLIHSLVVGTN